MIICRVGAELFHAERQTERQMDRRTDGRRDTAKLIVASRNFANVPKIELASNPVWQWQRRKTFMLRKF